jgi:hypothetical protein
MSNPPGKAPALLATCLLLLGAVAHAGPPPGVSSVRVEVGTVLASNQIKRIDQRLAGQGMQARLTRLFQYQSYELVSQESRQVEVGRPFRFVLPAGLVLRVQAERISVSGRVELRVELLEKDVRMVETSLTLGQQGRVVLGGRNHQGGVLLVWVGARTGQDAPQIPSAERGARSQKVPTGQALLPATAATE